MKDMKRFFGLRACCAIMAIALCAFLFAAGARADGKGGGEVETPVDKSFIELCKSGNAAEVKAAIAAGAALNQKDVMGIDDSPLMTAARDNPDLEVIKLLIEAGADINEREEFGNTPKILSLMNRNMEIAKAALI